MYKRQTYFNPKTKSNPVSSSFFLSFPLHFFRVQPSTYLSGAFIVHAQQSTSSTKVSFQAVGRTEHLVSLRCKAQGGGPTIGLGAFYKNLDENIVPVQERRTINQKPCAEVRITFTFKYTPHTLRSLSTYSASPCSLRHLSLIHI